MLTVTQTHTHTHTYIHTHVQANRAHTYLGNREAEWHETQVCVIPVYTLTLFISDPQR